MIRWLKPRVSGTSLALSAWQEAMMKRTVMIGWAVLASAMFPVSGCAEVVDEVDATSAGVIDAGSLEELGVLRWLNGPDATRATLDDEVALDSRAATNIAAHVRGADGALGTADDDLLGSIYELDAVAWVGNATIDKILAYVTAIGGIPSLVVEGVALTEQEADEILAVANLATLEELDADAALDARAATNIVAARPLADLAALAAVSYVGRVAIEHLRDFGATWTPATVTPIAFVSAEEVDAATPGTWQYDLEASGGEICVPETGDPGAFINVRFVLTGAPGATHVIVVEMDDYRPRYLATFGADGTYTRVLPMPSELGDGILVWATYDVDRTLVAADDTTTRIRRDCFPATPQ
jgi:hypothetical protein